MTLRNYSMLAPPAGSADPAIVQPGARALQAATQTGAYGGAVLVRSGEPACDDKDQAQPEEHLLPAPEVGEQDVDEDPAARCDAVPASFPLSLSICMVGAEGWAVCATRSA